MNEEMIYVYELKRSVLHSQTTAFYMSVSPQNTPCIIE